MLLFALALSATPVDLVVKGGPVITLTQDQTKDVEPATAFAIKDGRFVWVGSAKGVADFSGPTVDLKGRAVVPGLTDAHAHLRGLGAELEILDLRGCKSEDELVKRVASAPKKGAWIEGRGWDQNDWPAKKFPTRAALDKVTKDVPVALRRIDGHAMLVNSKALALAKIDDKTPDPKGGRILRDEKGAATGVLLDDAMALIEAVQPKRSAADIERQILAAQARALEVGLTGMHDMGTTKDELAVLRSLRAKGALKLRVYVALDGSDQTLLTEEFAKGKQLDPLLTVRSVKLYGDGALGSRGAALLQPYADDPKNSGLVITTKEALLTLAQQAKTAGYQVCVHAIGDAANRTVLDVYESVKGDRYRVEHAQVVDPQDWPRFAKSGVIASMQPTHATSDMDWAEARLGPMRIKGAYAWRSLKSAGARLAFGSDFPVEYPDPLLGLEAAVKRGNWRMSEALTFDEALRGFTIDAAYAAFEEKERGTIEKGKLADFVILQDDPRIQLKTKVVATYVSGQRQFQKE